MSHPISSRRRIMIRNIIKITIIKINFIIGFIMRREVLKLLSDNHDIRKATSDSHRKYSTWYFSTRNRYHFPNERFSHNAAPRVTEAHDQHGDIVGRYARRAGHQHKSAQSALIPTVAA